MNEPFGVVGVRPPAQSALLSAISLALPLLATGNRVVLVPPAHASLMFADLYQVLDTSDVPAGTLNIVFGDGDELAEVLALHDDVAALWYFGSAAGAAKVQSASAGNLKATWVQTLQVDWSRNEQAQGGEFMRHATQIKNIWIPYGE